MHEHIVLVDQGELLARTRLCSRKGVADDPSDAISSIDADLGRQLLRRTHPDRAAVADVRPFRPFADDDEVNDTGIGQRSGDPEIDPGRSQVDVVIELEAKSEQEPALKGSGGHGRIAHCSQQDRVMSADRGKLSVGQDFASRVPALRAEVELCLVKADIVSGGDKIEHLERLGSDLGANAVTRDNGELVRTTHAGHPRATVS